ncbi:MAG: hypothetical protein ABR499_13035 [Gemmatimonadaceae bacterium]
MKRSTAALALLLVLPSATAAQIGRLPRPNIPVKLPGRPVDVDRLPRLNKLLEQESPITTGLADAMPDVPSLDGFTPETLTPLTQLPRGPHGSFYLYPGVYWFEAESYCLRPGTYGPSRGDAYFHAALAGPKSAIVRRILQRSVDHPDIRQQEIQALLWAVTARTKVSDLSPAIQRTALRLLEPAEILELNGYGLGALSDAARERALANLPEPARKIFEAENRLRQMAADAETRFEDMERVAVLAGAAPPDPGERTAPLGRWSYHPDGYFIRYLPRSYDRTRIELYVPEQEPIVERDARGRVISVRPQIGRANHRSSEQELTQVLHGPRTSDGAKEEAPAAWPLKQFDGSGGVATPGKNAQRLGQSNRKAKGDEPDALDKARIATDRLGTAVDAAQFAGDVMGEGTRVAVTNYAASYIPGRMFDAILDFIFDNGRKIADALDMDPPRPDYKTYAMPERITVPPLVPSTELSVGRAAAANSLMDAAVDFLTKLRAAHISLDRAGGATRAGDEAWGSRQGAAYVYYKREAGAAMLVLADRLDGMMAQLRAEGVSDLVVPVEAVSHYRARLRAEGFTATERAAARTVGITDDELRELRERRLVADPPATARSVMATNAELAAALRELGQVLASLPRVTPPWTQSDGQ